MQWNETFTVVAGSQSLNHRQPAWAVMLEPDPRNRCPPTYTSLLSFCVLQPGRFPVDRTDGSPRLVKCRASLPPHRQLSGHYSVWSDWVVVFLAQISAWQTSSSLWRKGEPNWPRPVWFIQGDSFSNSESFIIFIISVFNKSLPFSTFRQLVFSRRKQQRTTKSESSVIHVQHQFWSMTAARAEGV